MYQKMIGPILKTKSNVFPVFVWDHYGLSFLSNPILDNSADMKVY